MDTIKASFNCILGKIIRRYSAEALEYAVFTPVLQPCAGLQRGALSSRDVIA